MLGSRPRQFGKRTWLAAGLVAMVTARAGSDDGRPRPATSPSRSWREGQPRGIAVVEGHSRFQVEPPAPGSRTLVVVSALARSGGPFPVRLSTRGTDQVEPPVLAVEPEHGTPRLEAPALAPIARPVARRPPPERAFHVLARDGDVASASNYIAIRGVLRALGERVQVYVDSADLDRVGAAVLRDLVTTFDGRVFPVAARTIGQASDIDADGRFTVLVSSWLGRLAGGRHAVDGFVRGADFDPKFASPFSNRCDMMYLSAALEPGPHLRTVLAHEYTHAVTYCAKTSGGPDGERPGADEEGWLDEALAHLGEDLHGFSRSNLDYRISAFLSNPDNYRLVVDDYYTADLFRSHGNRGSTYLFLRWCADRHGPALLPALVRSRLRGTANLEAATGMAFDDLYRRWSLALYFSGLDPSEPRDGEGFRSMDLRAPIDGWQLAGPRTSRVAADGGLDTWTASGTSSHFVVIDAAQSRGVDVEVTGPADAELQVTAVPLAAGLPDLDVRATVGRGPGGALVVRAEVGDRGGSGAELACLAWEPLVPAADPRRPGSRPGRLDRAALSRAFGSTTLPAGGTLRSGPIPLPGVSAASGPLIVKVLGTDRAGRRVSAWAEVVVGPQDGPAVAGKVQRIGR